MPSHKMKKQTKIVLTGIGVLTLVGGIAIAGTQVMASGGGYHGKHGGMRAHAMDLFDRIDGNADGKVARTEVAAYRDSLIERHDADNDRAINLDEFTGLLAEQMRPMIVDRFQALDDDGNGVITVAEIDGKVNRMMRRLDDNGDDAIELSELRHGKYRGHRYDDDEDDD